MKSDLLLKEKFQLVGLSLEVKHRPNEVEDGVGLVLSEWRRRGEEAPSLGEMEKKYGDDKMTWVIYASILFMYLH